MSASSYTSCKLCRLLEQDLDLWWEVHRRILDEHLSHHRVVKWLNSRVEVKNPLLPKDSQLPVFNRMNLQNHFAKQVHVKSLKEARKIYDEARVRQTLSQYHDLSLQPLSAATPGLADQSFFMSDVGEFKRMRALIVAMESRLHAFNEQMAKKEREGGDQHEVDLHEVARFQKLVSELLKLQKDAAQVEASSKIAGAALLDALGLLVEGTLVKVESTSREIHGILSREMPGSRLPDQISALMRTRIGDVIKLAIPQVLDTVHNRYGIK